MFLVSLDGWLLLVLFSKALGLFPEISLYLCVAIVRKRAPRRETQPDWQVVHDSQSETRFDIPFLPTHDRSL
jgi:hypothetical protein